MGGEKRSLIGTDVNAEGLSLISMKDRESATAPRQLAPAIIPPTKSLHVARSSFHDSSAFMLLSCHAMLWRRMQPGNLTEVVSARWTRGLSDHSRAARAVRRAELLCRDRR